MVALVDSPLAARYLEPIRGDDYAIQFVFTLCCRGPTALPPKSADALILIGRIMLAWVFVGVAYEAITNFAGSVAYFTSQKLFPPDFGRGWLFCSNF